MKYLFLFVLIAFPPMAWAGDGVAVPKMRHMSVTSAPSDPAANGKNAAEENPDITEKKIVKPLPPEQAIKKLDGLTEWPYYTDLMTIGNDTAIDKVVRMIDIDPGSVPPKGLLYAAKALSDRGAMEQAAFYYYAGQLRALFDMARFPSYKLGDDAKNKDRRTDDQIGRIPSAPPATVNPHEELSVLSLSIGQSISNWAMKDPDRLEALMLKVREWDLATPYAYKPDYDTSRAAPFETWAQLLAKTRNDYFTRVRQIERGLRSIQPVEPAPSFARP